MRLKALAELCRRSSTALAAGVDVRRNFAREAEGARGRANAPLLAVSAAINRGSSLHEALESTGDFFPLMFRQLVGVGEQTGHLAEVFRQLADHYDHRLELRRAFQGAIAWPLLQLGMALFVVGFLIWIMGVIGKVNNAAPFDIFGLGLVGNAGLVKYLLFLATVGTGIAAIAWAVRRGALWARPVQKLLLATPKLGRALNTLALARLTWSLHITLGAGMELRRALELSFGSTHSVQYTEQIPAVLSGVRSGRELYEVFSDTAVFPRDFLDSVHVGEQSGRLVETLAVLSREYQQEARRTTAFLTSLAGYAVWAGVAGMIILIIFRIFGAYMGVLNEALRGAGS